MKIFITGIAGFMGSSLAESLSSDGHEVFGIDNLFSGYRENIPENIPWIKGDISEAASLDKIDANFDAIVHLAAQTSGEKSFELPEYDLKTNMLGSFNVYNFAKKCQAKAMINASSMSAYGDAPHKMIVNEEYPAKPISLYGNTKLAAETMLSLMSKENEDGIPVVTFRPFNAYGPKQDLEELKQGMVSIYLAQFLKHEKVIVKGSFDRVRDFIYIDDIVSAIKCVLKTESPRSDVFNLSSGRLVSVGELIQLIKEISGIDKEVISQGNTKGDVMGFGGDNSKLKKEYEWAQKFSIEEGLKKMIEHYK
jgi:UDP-glucose 4-epimerase